MNLQIIETQYAMIAGYPGYIIGSDGSVWTLWKSKGGRGGMKIGDRPRKLTPSPRGSNSYLCVRLTANGVAKHFPVHILVLTAFIGPRPDGHVARHGPLGKSCNWVDNLRWGTQQENIADKERDGTKVSGVEHHNSKLTPASVSEARRDHAAGETSVALAARYGVRQSTMYAALTRQTWRDVA